MLTVKFTYSIIPWRMHMPNTLRVDVLRVEDAISAVYDRFGQSVRILEVTKT